MDTLDEGSMLRAAIWSGTPWRGAQARFGGPARAHGAPAATPGARLLAALAAGLALLAAAGGCSSSDPPPKLGYTAITRARARAVAPLLTIRAADLPEVKPASHPPSPLTRATIAADVSCAHHPTHDQLPAGLWASARSNTLVAGSGYHISGASSTAFVMSTPAAALSSIGQGTGPRTEVRPGETVRLMERCVKHAVLASVPSGLHVHGVVVKPLSMSVPGADASVAYETALGVRGAPLIIYFDSFDFVYGQDVIELTTYHSVAHVPRSVNERLLGLLVARARTHNR